jgi:hypothetical protein
MFRNRPLLQSIAAVLVAAGAFLLSTGAALADKLYLKDGSVLEGKVTREGKDFIFFKIKVGTVESETLYMMDKVLKIEKDTPAPAGDKAQAADAPKDDSKKGDGKTEGDAPVSGATRVAFLNFGPPSEWQGKNGDMVGVQISAEAFKNAVPLLEKAKADVVVIRINSGGGYLLEEEKFHDLFEHVYKKKFRTVCWVESAISAAAMSPWNIEEFYFFRKGNIGACTGWGGNLIAIKGVELEETLWRMEKVSALGKKDPKIMRSMQITDPLSVDIDENGEIRWRQDEDGKYILNKRGHILTLTASDACKFGFGKGIADTKEELAKVMNLHEVEFVGQEATDLVDNSIRDNDKVDKYNRAVLVKYFDALKLAQSLQDKARRGGELAKARKLLAEIKQMVRLNPNFRFHLGIDLAPEWFTEQEDIIKKIAAMP